LNDLIEFLVRPDPIDPALPIAGFLLPYDPEEVLAFF
jgi:hypothetical protein